MRCPNCDQPLGILTEPCSHCGFRAEPALLEEFAHVLWLLLEIPNWHARDNADRQHTFLIDQSYRQRFRALKIQLGLVFNADDASKAWQRVTLIESLQKRLSDWQPLINATLGQAINTELSTEVAALRRKLEGYGAPSAPSVAERLSLLHAQLDTLDAWTLRGLFVNGDAASQVRESLQNDIETLEIRLGLRPAKVVAPRVATKPPVATLPPTITPPRPPAPPLVPSIPLRDRFWRTLLSERTLQAMLFLGIFLLFAAALSFVIWGWESFSAPLRVAIPSGFTAGFFALGWYVRKRTNLYRSGIALSAIASLLIPIDFYTVYANFDIAPDLTPRFWLVTSLVCLAAYGALTLIIRSRFFGYLVGTAAGSSALALIEVAHQYIGLSLDWRAAVLSVLSVIFILIATRLDRLSHRTAPLSLRFRLRSREEMQSAWDAFAEPLRNLALLTVAVLMPLMFAWRFIDRKTFDTLHDSLTVTWWLGGFIFAWGAIYYRSRGLGLLAAIALPFATYLAQASLFATLHVNAAWHAVGWSLLVPLYFVAGHRLLARTDDAVLQTHGRTATRFGVVLLIVAALWSLTDLTSGAAAAVSHAVLAASLVLAALLWRRPTILYGASLLALTSATFAMTQLNLSIAQLSIGWTSLAIAHVIVAIRVGERDTIFARPLVIAGYLIAALALLPPLLPYNGDLFAYVLANWLALTAWGARLAHMGQPGFAPAANAKRVGSWNLGFRISIFHWLTALPLPVWMWVLFANRGPLDQWLPLTLAALAWLLFALSLRLATLRSEYRWAWYLVGIAVSIAAAEAAFVIAPNSYAPALTMLAAGLLFLTDAVFNRQSRELFVGGLVVAAGSAVLLDRVGAPSDALTLALALLVAAYIGADLLTERLATQFTHQFLAPLFWAAHVVSLAVLARIYARPFSQWNDAMLWWSAASQFVLAMAYAYFAWAEYKKIWAYAAVWLAAASGAFVALLYSTGSGSLAAKAALVAITFILSERGLHTLRHARNPIESRFNSALSSHQRGIVRVLWVLFREPLLLTGWLASAAVIVSALVRNLLLLGGGRTPQTWAAVGLLLIVGLYALSARLFRQARFVWLAALLVFTPWTILTNLGWFAFETPRVPALALSWVLLAWLLFALGLLVRRIASRDYALPLKIVAHVLMPCALAWGMFDVDTSRITFVLAVGFYGLASALDYAAVATIRNKAPSIFHATKFLYPWLGLIPVWFVYLLAWLLPSAHQELYGLMLIVFGPLGLVAGQWFYRIVLKTSRVSENPRGLELRNAYALPAYLTGYIALIVGTSLVAHIPALLALVLLYDAALMLASARVFKHPLWMYPATLLTVGALTLALREANVSLDRYGWWLIALAAIYLALAWTLRRLSLRSFATPLLTVGFALIALGLPPSSRDQDGALIGYASAALLYALSAFWLEQPLLLTSACALVIVPYAVLLQKLSIAPEYVGVALLPAAVVAVTLAVALDRVFGALRDFPWSEPSRWLAAFAERVTIWWALSLYALGFGLAVVSPFFSTTRSDVLALNCLLLVPMGAWAMYYFRLRVWLFATALAGHLAWLFWLRALGWWSDPTEAALRFVPVTLVTLAVALWIERRYKEGTPITLDRDQVTRGWSRVLYLYTFADLYLVQAASLEGTEASALVSLAHALVIAGLASLWLSRWLPYVSATLGVVAFQQWIATLDGGDITGWPLALAQLALAYGLLGFGIASLARVRIHPAVSIWAQPLQRFSLAFSFVILPLTVWLGVDVIGWTIRALLGADVHQIVRLPVAQMIVGVFSILGLLYLAAAFSYRRVRIGYAAIGMLLAAWATHVFYVQQWDGLARVQLYAMPAGFYVLSIAYLEWQRGHKDFARWLDYAAVLLLMGSLFWQTMLYGWSYALLLGAEGFVAFWWGSARRVRRFLYIGMLGVVLATIAQLINALQSINQWIIFGIIGLLVVITAVLVERKLEELKAWREALETWE